jgi:hypothetical protein
MRGEGGLDRLAVDDEPGVRLNALDRGEKSGVRHVATSLNLFVLRKKERVT